MTLYQHFTEDPEGRWGFWSYITVGQTFTPQIDHTITSVKLWLSRQGTVISVRVAIYETSGGLPIGSELCYGLLDGNEITENEIGGWNEVSMIEGVELGVDVMYAIVATYEVGDGENRPLWHWVLNPPEYTRGTTVHCSWEDGHYVTDPVCDMLFQELGTATIPTQYSWLKAWIDGAVRDLCVVPEGASKDGVRIKKGDSTYDIYLVETTDANASPIRMWLAEKGKIKAVRYFTAD